MNSPETLHPGAYIRSDVLPAGSTVKAAALQLGVGRPALSNLLNGKASLSPDMAMRLEKTFGANSAALLRMQADFDQAAAQTREPQIAVRAYTPSLLDIKAMQIEAWADRMAARSELAALLRRLVTSTAPGLTRVDFPAHENAQRHGWDGQVAASSVTPWVPLGESGWEFGVNQNPGQKAEHDYAARLAEVAASERKVTTFVFVTPRNWPGKGDWVAAKRAQRAWKDVRAYDASDLEQWLETSLPAQAWFAGRLPFDRHEILDLQGAWRHWADATRPPLSKDLFKAAAEAGAGKLARWLAEGGETPFTVVAESADEGLAALACAFEAGPLMENHEGERVVIVRTAEALARVATASSSFIVVLASGHAQAAANAQQQHPAIVVTHRNAVEGRPDLTVDLVGDKVFREGLEAMGLSRDAIERYGHESGRSLTVLRRRLATLPALRSPPWAQDKAVAGRLIPLMFVGAWDATSEADQAVVAGLAATDYEAVEKTVAELLGEPDSPAWSIGEMRGVVSKIDAFYAVHPRITKADLQRFFDLAHVVLSEEDPALDLPEDKRWLAGIYGKNRKHSGALRQGLCETLVLMSVHGDHLFRARLGFDVKASVDGLIRRLLTPVDGATWQSHRQDLPRYAEAAAEVFLQILDDDLRSPEPKVFALMTPADSSAFSSPGRTGLLWALETLAWDPQHLFQIVVILGKLASVEVTDNWVNRPENSLASIFRNWLPQTAAPLDQRIAALGLLVQRAPKPAWRICLNQFDAHSTIGDFTARPRWRAVPTGAGEGVDGHEAWTMARKALDMALAWPQHDAQTLGDLIERLSGIPDDQADVWQAVRAWLKTDPPDASKAALRERIRQAVLVSRHHRRRDGSQGPAAAAAPADIYAALEPRDLVWRHQWLFAQQWLRESAEEWEDENLDFHKRDERVSQRRRDALAEIWRALGVDGIRRLAAISGAPGVIGMHLAPTLSSGEAQSLVGDMVEGPSDAQVDSCLTGLLWALPLETRTAIIERAVAATSPNSGFSAPTADRLLRNAPFAAGTWDRVDTMAPERKDAYWRQVAPSIVFGDEAVHANRVIDELVRVERPRAAFASAHMVFGDVTSERLLRLVQATGTSNAEPAGSYMLAQHDISDVFEILSDRKDVDNDDLARLEFLFIEALSHTKHGIRNLERQISVSPSLFVQLVAYAFRRRDDAEDPPELRPPTPEAARGLASTAYSVLSRANRTPGADDNGQLDTRKLRDWIVETRTLAREHGRLAIGDTLIGQLLGRSRPGPDGVWPREEIREVLEDVGSTEIADGIVVGRMNALGAAWRGEGGAQERALAAQYREWAGRVAPRHPFTARVLLQLAARYDNSAEWHDNRSNLSKRLSD